MPIQRKLTEEELGNLAKQGIDPSQYKDKVVNLLTDEEVAGGGSSESKNTPQEGEGEKPGVISSIARTLKAHAGGTLGGGAAALALAPFTEGMSLIPALATMALGSTAGGMGGQKLQNTIQGDETTQRLEQQAQEAREAHPIISAGTDIASSALASGGAFSPSTTLRSGGSLIKALAGTALSDVEKETIKHALVNTVVNPAINSGVGLAFGETPTLEGIGEQALGGALFSAQSRLGKFASRGFKSEPAIGIDSTVVKPKEETTTQEQIASPQTPFTEKNGENYTIDDIAVKAAFKKLFPKPDIKGMSEVDADKASSEYRNKLKLPPEQQRQILSDNWTKQQKVPVKIPDIADEEAPINKTETWEDKAQRLWNSSSDFQRGQMVGDHRISNLDWENLNPDEQKKVGAVVDSNVSNELAQQQYKQNTTPEPAKASATESLSELDKKTQPLLEQGPAIPQEKLALTDREVAFRLAKQEADKQNAAEAAKKIVGIPNDKPLPPNSVKISATPTLVGSDVNRPESFDRKAYAPAPESRNTNEDVFKYAELVKKFNEAKGQEKFALWNELEALKNKYNGMPPEHKGANSPVTLTGPDGEQINIDTNKSITSAEALQHIVNAKGEHSDIAQYLLDHMDKNALKVPIRVDATDGTSTYDPREDEIAMHPEQLDERTIIHEILHGSIYKKIPKEFIGKRGYELKATIDEYIKTGDNEAIKELIRCYYEAAKKMGVHDILFGEEYSDGQGWIKGPDREEGGTQLHGHKKDVGSVVGYAGNPYETVGVLSKIAGTEHGYAMGDLHEFVSELMSNPEFAKHLNEMPSGLVNDKQSLWFRILNAFKKLLGANVKQGSLLERALNPVNELVKQTRPKTVWGETPAGERAYAKSPEEKKGTSENEVKLNTRVGGKVGDIFRSMTDSIRNIKHPDANDVADAFHGTLSDREKNVGKFLNPILEAADKLGIDKSQAKRINDIGVWMRENEKEPPANMFSSKAEKQLFDTIRTKLHDEFNERVKLKEPVIDNGKARMPQRNEFYWPTTTNSRKAELYRDGTNTAEIEKSDKEFLDHQAKLGKTPEESRDNLRAFKVGIQGSVRDSGIGNNQFFNAHRRPEGIPLPPSFRREGLQNIEAYFHRSATDMAYYKNVESNPKVMSALGETLDPWNKPLEKDPNGGIAGHPAVQAQLNEIRGKIGGAGYHNERAASSFATTLFTGPGTTIHKAISNTVGISGLTDNPYQTVRMLGKMVSNLKEGIEHAKENGIIKPTARSVYDVFDRNMSFAERMQAVAKGVRGIYTLADVTDKLGAGMMQAGSEYILPDKIKAANEGNKTAQNLLKKLDPSYEIGKNYDKKGIQDLASALVGTIHGTGDGRTMPAWMSGDSEISGFFKLSNWGISQTNRFFSDIYEPARRGDYKPLLISLFGAAVGGYLIKELRESLQGKKGQIPSLSEMESSSRELEGNAPLLAYNLMASLSYAGFGGMLTQFAKVPIDAVNKNTSQGMVFPLDELATDTVKQLHLLTTAIANDPNLNWFDLTKAFAAHMLTTNFQLGRTVYNQAIDNGLIAGTLAEKKKLSDKLGQLRRFDMVEDLPYNEQDNNGNAYMNLEQKKFKMEQDPTKIAEQLPELVSNIMAKYHEQPDVMMSKLKALKQNQYSTFPSLESTPIQFLKYLGYLSREKGTEAAQTELMDYLQHSAVNKAKAKVVP